MNFKTTIILILVLGVLGGAVFYLRSHKDDPTATTQPADQTTAQVGKPLFDIKPVDVQSLVIRPADGPEIAMKKTGDEWRLTKPVDAPAQFVEISTLVSNLVSLRSQGQVDPSQAAGLNPPRYSVEMTTVAGKTIKFTIGDRTALGDVMYVRLDGNARADVTQPTPYDQLNRNADDLRDKKLVSVPSASVRQVIVQSQTGPRIVLEKAGETWRQIEPVAFNADKDAVDKLVSSITTITVESFVKKAGTNPAITRLDNPQLTLSISTAAPATQPATTPASGPTSVPAFVTIRFGQFDNIRKENVYAMSSTSNEVVKVAAYHLDDFKQQPNSLRDRSVVNINTQEISQFTLTTDLPPVIQPVFHPGKKGKITVRRRGDEVYTGPPFTAGSTTQPATQPATAPALATDSLSAFKPKWPGAIRSKWEIVDPVGETDDIEVKALLDAFGPLRADKFLDKVPPSTQPSGSYNLRLTTVAAGGKKTEYQFRFINPGGGAEQPVIGEYNGLIFETSRSLLTNLDSTFKKKAGSELKSPEPQVP